MQEVTEENIQSWVRCNRGCFVLVLCVCLSCFLFHCLSRCLSHCLSRCLSHCLSCCLSHCLSCLHILIFPNNFFHTVSQILFSSPSCFSFHHHFLRITSPLFPSIPTTKSSLTHPTSPLTNPIPLPLISLLPLIHPLTHPPACWSWGKRG